MEEYKIEWRGNECTNYSSREGNIPIIIKSYCRRFCRKLTAGFTHCNKQSSAHFLVTFEGEIKQYVEFRHVMKQTDWNLIIFQKPKVPLLEERTSIPHLYSVSIEHEGKPEN